MLVFHLRGDAERRVWPLEDARELFVERVTCRRVGGACVFSGVWVLLLLAGDLNNVEPLAEVTVFC